MNHLSDNQLNEYLDHMLDEAIRDKVAAHLADCPTCTSKLGALQRVFHSLEQLPDVPLAQDLTPAVLASLQPLPGRVPRTRTLAAQWGVILGFSLWLGIQLRQLVHLPPLKEMAQAVVLPTFNETTQQVLLHLTRVEIPDFRLSAWEPPAFALPTIQLDPSNATMIALAVAVFLLWLVGNFTLLKRGQKAPSSSERRSSS